MLGPAVDGCSSAAGLPSWDSHIVTHLTVGHQSVDLGHGDFFADGRQVQVDHGTLQRTVSQILLDLAEVDTGFQKMGGVAVA